MKNKLLIPITLKQALDYEIRGHWLASWIWFDWGQELLSRYFVRKVTRKYKRYNQLIKLEIKHSNSLK